jgi:hypothetical protein
MPILIRGDHQGKTPALTWLRAVPILEAGGIVPGETMIGELGIVGIALRAAERAVSAVYGEEGETVAFEETPHSFYIMVGRQKRVDVRRIGM